MRSKFIYSSYFFLSKAAAGIPAAAVAGFIATIPQTLVMVFVRVAIRFLFAGLATPGRFPPRQVAEGAVARLAGRRHPPALSEFVWLMLTTISHFGYGATAGAMYPLIAASQIDRGHLLRRGSLYGLLIWSESYLALLPALHIVKPQGDHPVRKNLQLIAAHLAWGVSMIGVYDWLNQSRRSQASFKSTYASLAPQRMERHNRLQL